jgi:hypothetical protein
MSSSLAFSRASSGAFLLFSGRSAACGPNGPVHAAYSSSAATPTMPGGPSCSALASNAAPLPGFARHSRESGAPVSCAAAPAACFCTGSFNAAIISRSVVPGAAATCPLTPCGPAAHCAADPAILLNPVAVKLQVVSSVPGQCPDSHIPYSIDLSSARRACDEQIPLPAAQCSALMHSPAASASASRVHDAAASTSTQLAPQHHSSAAGALSPPDIPNPSIRPPSRFSASVSALASSRGMPSPGHPSSLNKVSPPAAPPPSVARPTAAAGFSQNQRSHLSPFAQRIAAEPRDDATRQSSALQSPPASPSASYAALGEAAGVHVSKKGVKGERKCARAEGAARGGAPSLSSSSCTASCVDSRQLGGGTTPLRQSVHEHKNARRVCRRMQESLPPPWLPPQQLAHEDGASCVCSSSKRCMSDAMVVAVLLCLSCILNVAAAQEFACPGAWSTAALSVARRSFAATSLPNQGLAMFAGGYTGL